MKEQFETQRLALRPWKEEDARELYRYAKDDRVGPIAGWPAHVSVEDSRGIIKSVLSADGTYAVVLKTDKLPVGSIGLMVGKASNLGLPDTEAEIGYWIGVPYWGQGLIPEAMRTLMRYAFDELGMNKLWCGYFEGNEKSRRVQEKCGFIYHHTIKDRFCPLLGDIRPEHITCISSEQWKAGARRENSDNALLQNLEKLHTTELGNERIKRNLNLDAEDAVDWCRRKALSPDCSIAREGKNWYITTADCRITVNAYSYTIITAHRLTGR